MKKLSRIICLSLCLVLVITFTGCGNKSKFTKEGDMKTFQDELLYEMILMDPESANYLYFDETLIGKPMPYDKLTDISKNKAEENTEVYEDALKRLNQFKDADLDSHELIQKKSLEVYLNEVIKGNEFYDYQFFVDYGGFQIEFFNLMNNYHKINSLEDAENYVERIKAFEPKIKEITENVKLQKEKGLLPPKVIFTNAIVNINSQIKVKDIQQNPVYISFVDKINKINDIEKAKKDELIKEVESVLTESVYPALTEYRDYLMSISSDADKEVGLDRLPKGNEYYQYLLEHYTTTDYTAEELHALGLKEVERIQGEMRTLLDDMGYKDKSISDAYNEISSKTLVIDKEDILKRYKDIISTAEGKLSELFEEGILPKVAVEVRAVPEELAGSLGNSYMRPSRDGKTPGIFQVELEYTHSTVDMETLAFHEAVPGHHLQMAVQSKSEYCHPISEMTFYTGFIEGWALYAEKVAYEEGFFSSDESKLGYLQSELFRAARLVVDTGLHYKNWSQAEAEKYMVEATGLAYDVTRYIQMPGQATAYKVGELKIVELREKAKQKLGDKFDLKEFHTVVLEEGNIPLTVLEYKVYKYIEDKK